MLLHTLGNRTCWSSRLPWSYPSNSSAGPAGRTWCAFPVNRPQAAAPLAIPAFVHFIPHALFTLFFPDECRLCKRPLSKFSAYPVCTACIEGLQPLSAEFFCSLCRTPFLDAASLDESGRCALCQAGTRHFDAAYAFGAYDAELRDLIHLFKYARMRSLHRPLGRMLRRAIPLDEVFDAIVPVPMHWWRRHRRGFNQAELLARAVCEATGIPLMRDLRRLRRTPPQAGLTHDERQLNLSGAFQVRGNSRIRGRRILLIDDVMTTGATASACAAALKKAGAASVILLTLARVDRRWAETSVREPLSGASTNGNLDQTAKTGTRPQREL